MKIHKIKIYTLILLALFIFNTNITHATVGGPTFISNIQSSNSNFNEIIYEEQDLGGRGCPPEVNLLNIQTGETKVLLSCNQLEQLSDQDRLIEYELTLSKYPTVLKKIDLNKNNVKINVGAVFEQKMDIDKGIFASTDFSIDILQDDVKKATLTYSGCKPNQPQVISGYMALDGKTLILIVSTIGDCFEGGYIRQRIFPVGDMKILYQNPLPISEINEDLTADSGDILFTAKPINQVENKVEESTDNKLIYVENKSNEILYYQALIGILLILIIGLILNKTRKL